MRFNPITVYAGLASGGGAALWTLFEYAMGWHNEHLETGAVTGFIAILFPILATVWALRATKRASGGRLTLKQALLCGLSVSAISAAIGLVFFYAYYTSINPDFIELMKARGEDVNVTAQLMAVGVGSFVFGIVISTIAGLFLKTQGTGEKNER